MRIIALSKLRAYWEQHPQSQKALEGWYFGTSQADWKTPAAIKAQYRNASFLANNRVVFNIKGHDYRLVVAVMYQAGILFIKFVGSHAEYDQINAVAVEHKT